MTLRPKKIFLILTSLVVILSISFVVFLYFFLKSPSFLSIIEANLKSRLEMDVDIGSISLSGKHGVIIEDFIIKYEDKGKFHTTLPYIEIGISLSGLLNRQIETITVREPKIFLGIEKDNVPESKKRGITLPFSFKKASVENGEIIFQPVNDKSFHVKSISLFLNEMATDQKVKIKGDAFLSDLDSTLSFETGLDLKNLSVDRGRIDIGLIELETLSTKNLTFLNNRKLKGSFNLSADISKEEKGLGVKLNGAFKNLTVDDENDKLQFLRNASGELHALLSLSQDYQVEEIKTELAITSPLLGKSKEDIAVIKANYNPRELELKIESASLKSSILGFLDIEGNIKNLQTKDITYDLRLRAKDVSIYNLNRDILGPLGIGIESLDYQGMLDGKTNINGSMTRGIIWESELYIKDLLIQSESVGINLKNKPLKLSSKGKYDAQDDHLKIEFLRTQLLQLKPWKLQGIMAKLSSGSPGMNFKIEGEDIPIDVLKEALAGPMVKQFKEIDIKGNTKADLDITGNISNPIIIGDFHVKGDHIKKAGAELKSFDIRFTANKRENEYVISNAKIRADTAVFYNNGLERYKDKDIFITVDVEGNIDKRSLMLKKLSLSTQSIKGISGDISLDLNSQIVLSAVMAYKGFNLETEKERFSNFFPAIKEVSIEGNGDMLLNLVATIPEKNPLHISGKTDLQFTNGSFSSPDATNMGEGINMNLSSDFEFSLPIKKVAFNVSTEASDFELLIGMFYGSFKEKRLSLSAEGEYIKDTDSIKVSHSALGLTDVGNLLISGQVSNLTETPNFDVDINLKKLSNNEAYNFFIRETFEESFPFLSQIKLDGTASSLISVEGTADKFNAKGKIKIVDMDITGDKPDHSITGINMFLPVDISYPEVTDKKEVEQFGYVRFQDISWDALNIKELEVFPVIWQNSIHFREDITMPIFGGNIKLKDITYKGLLSAERKLLLSMDIDTLDLAELSVALDMPKFAGNLTGTIPRASFIGSSLLTEGAILLELFGGKTTIKEISINNVFSPITSLKSSVELEEIDLGKLTSTFEFGHISGILQGFIKDLVITKGQIESFKALIETVKKRRIKQKISVEALEKITVLGTGSSTSILNQGIYQFFNEYRYKKMGFRGWLENDNLTLLGIDLIDNKWFLVNGGLIPPNVNVINHIQKISFKELVKRLKRVKLIGNSEGMRVD